MKGIRLRNLSELSIFKKGSACFPKREILLAAMTLLGFLGTWPPIHGQVPAERTPSQPSDAIGASASSAITARDLQSLPDTGRQQMLQQHVRETARRLLSEQISLQITQLEENGLVNLPLYADLKEMAQHLDELVDQHMREVLSILAEMSGAAPDARVSLLSAAREKSRYVLAQLILERQRVLRRLRLAEIEELARQLIAREKKVRERTELLTAQPALQRGAQALSVREDQRDVQTLYSQVQQFLEDITGWGGPVGRTARLAVQSLQEERVAQLFGESLQALSEARFLEAIEREDQIIAALQKLLKRIASLRGEFDRDNPAAIHEILEQLAQRQEELRDRTLSADSPETFEKLTQEQIEISSAIRQVANNLPQEPPSALQKAAEAATRAAGELFQNQADTAAVEQQKVVENLAQARAELERQKSAAGPQGDILDASSARQQEADLLAAREALKKLREEQSQASAEAASQRLSSAAERERKIAQGVAEVPRHKVLPENVNSAINQAAKTVHRVGEQLAGLASQSVAAFDKESKTPSGGTLPQAQGTRQPGQARDQEQSPEETREPARIERSPENALSSKASALTRQAEQAIDEALSAVEMALADAQRRRLAAEVVEHARAAWTETSPKTSPQWEAVQQTARQLREITGQQLEQARQARQAVERYLPELSKTEDPAGQLESLERARREVLEAAALQQEAAGQPELAHALRHAVSPEQALDLLHQAVAQAEQRQSDASPPDPEKQRQVTAAIQKAEESVGRLALPAPDEANRAVTQAKQSLEKAEQLSRQAEENEQSAEPSTPEGRRSLPNAVTQELAKAAAHLNALAAQIAAESQPSFAEHARSAENLASAAIPVHPEATAQLHAAENTARMAAEGSTPPGTMPRAQAASTQAFTGAVSALAERERQLAAALEAATRLPELLPPFPSEGNAPAASSPEEGPSTSERGHSAEPVHAALAGLQSLAAQAASGHPQSLTQANQSTQPSSRSSPQGQGGAAQQGGLVQNQTPAEIPVNKGAIADTDSRTGRAGQLPDSGDERAASGQAWLLQLPPEVRDAIRAGLNAPVPKGYEDRLRRYFQNAE